MNTNKAAVILTHILRQCVGSNDKHGSPVPIGWFDERAYALQYAVYVLENTDSNVPQCQECFGFTNRKLTVFDDRLMCPDCVEAWRDEMAAEGVEE